MLVEFFEEVYRDFDHWVDIDVARCLYDVAPLDAAVCVENMSAYGKLDIRNFLLHRVGGIKTDVLWHADDRLLPVSREHYDWLTRLQKVIATVTKSQFECFVLFSLYPIYLVEQNLRHFASNFQSFTYLAQFYNILNTMSAVKFSCMHVKRVFAQGLSLETVAAGFEDDVVFNIVAKAAGTFLPNMDEIDEICCSLYVASQNPKAKKEISTDLLARLMSCPKLIVNSLLLLMFKNKETKTKTTFFTDMMKICIDSNRNSRTDFNMLLQQRKRAVKRKRSTDTDHWDGSKHTRTREVNAACDVKEFHDPLVYVENRHNSAFVDELRHANVVYEYKATSEGFVAVKYGYTFSGKLLAVNSIEAYTNVRTLKLYRIGSMQYRTKLVGIGNFINRLHNDSIVVSYSHDIKHPTVEKLLKLEDDGGGKQFNAESFRNSLESVGVNMRNVPKNLNKDNFRHVIQKHIADTIHGTLRIPLRNISKFTGNDVNIRLDKSRSFVQQLGAMKHDFVEFLKSFDLTVVLPGDN